MPNANYVPSKTTDIKDTANVSLQTVLDSKTRSSDSLNVGVYVPLFESATQLSTISNTFAVLGGGGLVSNSAGTNAQGRLWFPAPILTSIGNAGVSAQPFRFAALCQIGSDSTNQAEVTIRNSAQGQSAIQCLFKNGSVTVNTGFTTIMNAMATGATTGTKFWFYVNSDGTTVTFGTMPYTAHGALVQGISGFASLLQDNASPLSIYAVKGSSTTATASGASSNAATAVTVSALSNPVPPGVTLTWSGGAKTLVASPGAAKGATSIPVSATWGGAVGTNIANGETASAGIPVFDNWNQILIASASASNAILGVAYTTGYAGFPDSRLQPPAIYLNPNVSNGETAGVVRIPGSYTGRTPQDIVQVLHPSGNDYDYAFLINGDSGAAFASLSNSYIVCSCRGSTDGFTNTITATANVSNGATSVPVSALKGGIANSTVITWPSGATTTLTSAGNVGDTSLAVSGTWGGTASQVIKTGDVSNAVSSSTYLTGRLTSNWGAPEGLAFRKALTDWIRANFPNTRNLYLLGQSMGGLNALQYALVYPGTVKAIANISGVYNLSYSYSSESFSSFINAGFTSTTLNRTVSAVADIKGEDPALRNYDFLRVPIKLWFGDATDTTLSSTQHYTNALTNLTNAGVSATGSQVSSAGHLAATLYDATAIAAFFAANP